MFAVIRTGGKQYKVAEKDVLEVEKLDAKAGDKVDLEVVMTSDGKGAAMSKGKVTAKVIEQTRGDKVIVFKKKRRQNYRRTKGHRQNYTMIEITSIAA